MSMSTPLEISTFGLVLFVLLAILLFGLMRGLRWLLSFVPMSKAARQTINRIVPVAETIITLVYLLSAVPMVLNEHPKYTPIVLVVILVGFAWVSWFALREFINGVFFKAGLLCTVGDHVTINETSGRILEMGYRYIVLETDDGDEAIIPYSRLSRQSVVRTPHQEGECRHEFKMHLPPNPAEVSQRKLTIKSRALNCHWSSLLREPRVELLGSGLFEVTVYALDREHGPVIEAAVKDAFAVEEDD
jgi:small-conductance mechanosensitive channel